MDLITPIVEKLKRRSRNKRSNIFNRHFKISPQSRILDLGSEDGSHIAMLLKNTTATPSNVYIADLFEASVKAGQKKYGFTPVVIKELQQLPFEDNFFDTVFCNSAIEHVTIPKEEIWQVKSGKEFKTRSWSNQQKFAEEIRRVSRSGYFVQTPYKWFPITSHIWLPLVGWFPRSVLIAIMHLTNKIWIKKTIPDWYLMNKKDLQMLFPDAKIITEKFAGFAKSIVAMRNRNGDHKSDTVPEVVFGKVGESEISMFRV